MKSSTLKIISLVFLGLLAFWVFTTYFKKPSSSQNPVSQFSLSAVKEKTDSFILEKGPESLTLKRENGRWLVTGRQADQEKVKNLLEALNKLTVSGPVSRNPENHAKFEVDQGSGLYLILKDQNNQEITSFFVGKQGPDYTTSYLRKKDQDEVYLAAANLRTLLPFKAEDWRDKTIVTLDRQPIKKVEFIYPQEKFTLELQEDSSWLAKNRGEKQVADETINSFFDTLNPLTAAGFIEDEAEINEFNESKNGQTIRFLKEDNSLVTQLNLLEKDNFYWVKANDQETIFKVASTFLDAVVLKSADLF